MFRVTDLDGIGRVKRNALPAFWPVQDPRDVGWVPGSTHVRKISPTFGIAFMADAANTALRFTVSNSVSLPRMESTREIYSQPKPSRTAFRCVKDPANRASPLLSSMDNTVNCARSPSVREEKSFD
jgi:hypothetical protein